MFNILLSEVISHQLTELSSLVCSKGSHFILTFRYNSLQEVKSRYFCMTHIDSRNNKPTCIIYSCIDTQFSLVSPRKRYIELKFSSWNIFYIKYPLSFSSVVTIVITNSPSLHNPVYSRLIYFNPIQVLYLIRYPDRSFKRILFSKSANFIF